MLPPEESRQALIRHFHRHRIANLEALFELLETHSRMSVFRRLSTLGYHSCYSHAGRYYTLGDIPRFDADGLWHYQGVHFSAHGSLKATVQQLVDVAEAGRTHVELHSRLDVRVHNTLLDLVQGRQIGRERVGGQYLYVCADPEAARLQITRRQEVEWADGRGPEKVSDSTVIEVLLEVIRGARVRPNVEAIAARLASRGVPVTPSAVQAIIEEHGVKKTAGSRSRRSR